MHKPWVDEGICRSDWYRRRRGDTTAGEKRLPIEDKLARDSALDPLTGCQIWWAKIDRDGYPRVWSDGKQRGAHRVAYELTKGLIPEGLDLDHICRVRRCINPDHLEPVTGPENTRRGISPYLNSGQKKFVCDKCGGPLEVIASRAARNGRNPHLERGCRPCRTNALREWKAGHA